jgi:hypothetical protein
VNLALSVAAALGASCWLGALAAMMNRVVRDLREVSRRLEELSVGGHGGAAYGNGPLRDGQAGDIEPPP